MLPLTTKQLANAIHAANDLRILEAAKDQVAEHVVRVQYDVEKNVADPFGQRCFVDVKVPKAEILRQLEQRIADARGVLLALGIELTPGE